MSTLLMAREKKSTSKDKPKNPFTRTEIIRSIVCPGLTRLTPLKLPMFFADITDNKVETILNSAHLPKLEKGQRVTAINSMSNTLIVGYQDGHVQLFEVLNLKPIINLKISNATIEKLLKGVRICYVVSKNTVTYLRVEDYKIMGKVNCQGEVRGVIKGEQGNYLVDSLGKIYWIGREYNWKPEVQSLVVLMSKSTILGLTDHISQIYDYIPRQQNFSKQLISLSTYQQGVAIVGYDERHFPRAKVLFAPIIHFGIGRLSQVQTYDSKMYYLNVLEDEEITFRVLWIRDLDQISNDKNMSSIQVRSGRIELYKVLNDKICCYTDSHTIEVFNADLLGRTHELSLRFEVTVILLINSSLILGTSNGEIISKDLKDESEICKICRHQLSQRPFYRVCCHKFPETLPIRTNKVIRLM